MRDICREVQGRLQTLDVGTWDGVSRTRAQAVFERVEPKGEFVSNVLTGLGQKLQRVADKYENVDRAGANALSNAWWVNWDVPPVVIAHSFGQEPSTFRVSQEGLDYLKQFEGLSLELYNDPGKNCTIGWGHLVHRGPCDGRPSEAPFADGITMEQAEAMFQEDVERHSQAVRDHVKVPLTQRQFDALSSFAYNVGPQGFADSDVLTVLNTGNYEGVPRALMRHNIAWDEDIQAYREFPGLTRRRREEGEMFLRDILR